MTILRTSGSRYGIWWEDPAFYDVYDDFEDASIDGGKWTTTLSGTGTRTITEAGGVVTCYVDTGAAQNGVAILESNNITANKSVAAFFRMQSYAGSGAAGVWAGNATDGWSGQACSGSTGTGATLDNPTSVLLVLAKGGNYYDVYVGGVLVGNNVYRPNGMKIQANCGNASNGTMHNFVEFSEVRTSK